MVGTESGAYQADLTVDKHKMVLTTIFSNLFFRTLLPGFWIFQWIEIITLQLYLQAWGQSWYCNPVSKDWAEQSRSGSGGWDDLLHDTERWCKKFKIQQQNSSHFQEEASSRSCTLWRTGKGWFINVTDGWSGQDL